MNQPLYYSINPDIGDCDEGELPEVRQDMLIPTENGLKLVSQAVVAKGGRRLLDQLVVIGPLLLRDTAYQSLHNLRICPSIQWYPVTVTWRKSKNAYWVGYTLAQHDIWDYERSDYTPLHKERPRGTKNVGLFRHGVAIPELLPELDLFRARFGKWVGSESMKQGWEKASFTGMAFTKLDIAEAR